MIRLYNPAKTPEMTQQFDYMKFIRFTSRNRNWQKCRRRPGKWDSFDHTAFGCHHPLGDDFRQVQAEGKEASGMSGDHCSY
jgi:hypothetical protein